MGGDSVDECVGTDTTRRNDGVKTAATAMRRDRVGTGAATAWGKARSSEDSGDGVGEVRRRGR